MRPSVKACLLAALVSALPLPLLAQSDATAAATTVGADSSTAYYLLHHPRALARFLGLSASQTTSLLGFWKTLEQTVEPLRQAREPLCAQLRTDLNAGTPDPGTVGSDTINLFDNKQQIIAARQAFDTSFSAILNPAQLAQYDALKQLARLSDPEFNVIGECPPPSS
jgi:hypothetical protein